MTAPEYRSRRMPAGRRFDLRATAVFFVLAALGLGLAGLVARTAFSVAEHRPAWAVVLLCGAVVAVVLGRRGHSRLSARRLARRTTRALEQATATALDELATEPPARPAVPAQPREVSGTVRVVDLAALSPDEFEQAIADLCVRDGCAEVEVVGGAGDLGADVRAVTPDGRRLVIQCKRYGGDHKVGSEELQRFGGTCFTVHEADVAVLVTSSDFTAPAADYAEQCGIVCVDGHRLREWTEGLGPQPWAVGTGVQEAADLPDRAPW
ncbi:restriction endonuclease [Streptomyces sp. NPDC047725]|uniref:restriction endonuclease n=1 Tax=Streptomyces sp. NPDC047725 TaxID=3365487 RepID=UPI0037142B4E